MLHSSVICLVEKIGTNHDAAVKEWRDTPLACIHSRNPDAEVIHLIQLHVLAFKLFPTECRKHALQPKVSIFHLSPDSISSNKTCDSDTSDTSWPVISPATSEDDYSATDSNSEPGNEMLEADGHDSVANFQDDDISAIISIL